MSWRRHGFAAHFARAGVLVRAIYTAFLRPRIHLWLVCGFSTAFLRPRSLVAGLVRVLYAAFWGRAASSRVSCESSTRCFWGRAASSRVSCASAKRRYWGRAASSRDSCVPSTRRLRARASSPRSLVAGLVRAIYAAFSGPRSLFADLVRAIYTAFLGARFHVRLARSRRSAQRGPFVIQPGLPLPRWFGRHPVLCANLPVHREAASPLRFSLTIRLRLLLSDIRIPSSPRRRLGPDWHEVAGWAGCVEGWRGRAPSYPNP